MDPLTGELCALHTRFTGSLPSSVIPLKGDASDRRLFRLAYGDGSCIGVIGPNIEENRAFIGFARTFREAGLRVPRIEIVSDDLQMYLEEDLGDVLFSDWQQEHREGVGVDGLAMGMYRRILDELLRFQIDAADDIDYSLCYQTEKFGTEAMLFDICYFRDNFLARLTRVPWENDPFMRDAAELVRLLCEEPRSGFLYRDFQSRNVMIKEDEPWFIDFQSGRRGAPQYDVASMLYDSRGGLSDIQRDDLLAHYIKGLAQRRPVDEDVFRRRFHGFAILRLMQALGAFGNLGLNKGKPSYLDLIPSRLQSLHTLASTADILDETPYLQELLIGMIVNRESLIGKG